MIAYMPTAGVPMRAKKAMQIDACTRLCCLCCPFGVPGAVPSSIPGVGACFLFAAARSMRRRRDSQEVDEDGDHRSALLSGPVCCFPRTCL